MKYIRVGLSKEHYEKLSELSEKLRIGKNPTASVILNLMLEMPVNDLYDGLIAPIREKVSK